MNYKQISKKKKKNTFILVVSLVLSLVLVGGAIAGVGYAFDWWGEGKALPTSTYNVNVASIDEILGAEISEADLAFYQDELDAYEASLKDWELSGSDEESKPVKPEFYMTYGNLLLNVDTYGVDFELPESGLYDITLKVNGQKYDFEKITFNADAVSEYLTFTSTFEGELIDENIYEFDVEGFLFSISNHVALSTEASFEGNAVGIIFTYYSMEDDFESFELVKFEKVAELTEA